MVLLEAQTLLVSLRCAAFQDISCCWKCFMAFMYRQLTRSCLAPEAEGNSTSVMVRRKLVNSIQAVTYADSSAFVNGSDKHARRLVETVDAQPIRNDNVSRNRNKSFLILNPRKDLAVFRELGDCSDLLFISQMPSSWAKDWAQPRSAHDMRSDILAGVTTSSSHRTFGSSVLSA